MLVFLGLHKIGFWQEFCYFWWGLGNYGSFITTKANPGDIDFVMLIEHETFDRQERLIERRFRRHKAKQE